MKSLAVTFYSYKGGVGRTLAMLNTAQALVRLRKKVFLWELDLEAPGLLQIPQFDSLRPKVTGGTIDILATPEADLKAQIRQFVLTHSDDLLILPAGPSDATYFTRYNQVPWKELFSHDDPKPVGNNLLYAMRKAIDEIYQPDFLLIDARTGITDLGAVSTLQLPEVIVLVMHMSHQGAKGAAIAQQIFDAPLSGVIKPREKPAIYRIVSHVPENHPLVEKRRRELTAQGLAPTIIVPLTPELLLEERTEGLPAAYTQPFEELAAKLIGDAEPKRKATLASRFEPLDRTRNEKGKTFEQKVVEVLRLLDFEVEADTHRDGRQIDFIARQRQGLADTVFVGECKAHAKPVGVSDLDALYGRVTAFRRAEPNAQGLLIAEQAFTDTSRDYARGLGLILWTYDELLTRLVNLTGYDNALLRDYEGLDIERLYVEQDVYPETGGGEKIALNALIDRFVDDDSARFQLILGDYGTGKTWFTRKIAAELARVHQQDSRSRQPVRISLRDAAKAIDLDGILHGHFQRILNRSVNPQSVLRLNEEGRLILIFDAFDEMATQADWEVTRQNFREILRCVSGNAKVILTCRTHYFKDQSFVDRLVKGLPATDLGDKPTELYREVFGREGVRTAYLRGFDSTQMRTYVERACGAQAESVLSLIASSEPLQQIGEKPVLLEMIVKSAPQLERLGRDVTVADLYAIYTEEWFERQDWRMKFTRENRRALVEELALRLWGRESAKLHFSELRDVVAEFLPHESKTVQALDAADHEVRTASFLVRDVDGNYGFSHRSFLEYFLACALMRKGPAALAIARLSPTVLQFLCDLSKPAALLGWCRSVLTNTYQPSASENAVLLWKQLKTPALGAPLQLAFAQLEGIDLRNAPMAHADLRGADLFGARLPGPRLEGANLSGANLTNAILDGVNRSRVNLTGCDLRATRLWDGQPLGSALRGPVGFGAVNCVAWSGERLAVAEDRFIRVLDARTGEWRTLSGHESWVRSVSWSGDGRMLASGSDDKTVRFWEVESGRAVRTLFGHGDVVMSVAWSGRILASGSDDNTVRLWDVMSGHAVRTLSGHENGVRSVAWSGDGRMLASGSDDNTVCLWDVESGQAVRTLSGHEDVVCSVAWSDDGRMLGSGSYDKTVRLWEVESGRLVRTLSGHRRTVTSVAWSGNGQLVASGSLDKTVRLWKVESGEAVGTLSGHESDVRSVAWCKNGRILASGSYDHMVMLWEVESARLVRTLSGHEKWALSVAWSGDGQMLASGSSDEMVRLWGLQSGRLVRTRSGHAALVSSVAWSGDGRILASSSDKTASLWEVESDRVLKLSAHGGAVRSVAWSGDGRMVASGSYDKTIKLWEVEGGRLLRTLWGHGGGVLSVAWSGDGRTVASGSYDKTIRLWEVESAPLVRALCGHEGGVRSVAWSGDGHMLASASDDKTIRLWEVKSGREVRKLSGHDSRVRSVAWSPDGRIVASASDDKTIRLWDVESGRAVCTFLGNETWVLSVVWSPDGTRIVSGAADGTIRIWDLHTGLCIAVLWTQSSGATVTYVLAEDGVSIAGMVTEPADRPKIRFTQGLIDYPYEAFAHLENPELVAQRLRGK